MAVVCVIGGGAAGMIAAYAAAKNGATVTLVEKNEKLGKKVFITGKGRCNVTNAASKEQFFENVCNNEKFLYSAFHEFDNHKIWDLLEGEGCKLKVERGERVFPLSDHSSDVIAAFTRLLKREKVEILLNTTVKRVETVWNDAEEGKKRKQDKRVGSVILTNGKRLLCDSCIVCTGGMSYPGTGSTGDGYDFARDTGHQIKAVKPALVPLETEEEWCKDLMGLALKNVKLQLICDKKERYYGFGEMLFTHFGVSGPLVLSASSFYSRKEWKEKGKLIIDLKPALDREQLDKRLQREFEENSKKQFKNALGGLFPGRLIPVMILLSGIQPDKKVNEITREERKGFAEVIKHLTLTIKGTRSFQEAIITQGGISVKDINPSTMESKLVEGMYFAGEVMDVDALTGGYNLQIAWSSGYLAGVSAANQTKS